MHLMRNFLNAVDKAHLVESVDLENGGITRKKK
jgi:hypothetical protein